MTIDYSKSYWKNNKVMLRLSTLADWEAHYLNYFDSHGRFLLNYEIELPADPDRDKVKWAEFVSPQATHGRIVFTVENLSGEVVGVLNLNSIDTRNGTFSIGMQINLAHRGQGYGTAALEVLLDYAFYERRLHKFNVSLIEGNLGSETMLQKLGCVREGVRREVVYHQGKYWNEVLYGLTAQEYDRRPEEVPQI